MQDSKIPPKCNCISEMVLTSTFFISVWVFWRNGHEQATTSAAIQDNERSWKVACKLPRDTGHCLSKQRAAKSGKSCILCYDRLRHTPLIQSRFDRKQESCVQEGTREKIFHASGVGDCRLMMKQEVDFAEGIKNGTMMLTYARCAWREGHPSQISEVSSCQLYKIHSVDIRKTLVCCTNLEKF